MGVVLYLNLINHEMPFSNYDYRHPKPRVNLIMIFYTLNSTATFRDICGVTRVAYKWHNSVSSRPTSMAVGSSVPLDIYDDFVLISEIDINRFTLSD